MFNWNPCPSWSPLYYVSVRRKLFKFNFFIRNSFSRHHIKNKSFNYIQNFNEYFDYFGEFPFVTNGTCVLLRDRKRLLQLSRCIDYHRLFRYRFPPIFVYLVALSTLQGLETYREAGLSSFFFFSFFFFPFRFFTLFPLSSHSTFPICIEMKTYLFGGLRPKSPFVFGRMDVPCTREFVYTSLCICREHARFHRAPLLFIRFLLLFSVSRTESTMKKEDEEEEDSPCAIVPTFECIRM